MASLPHSDESTLASLLCEGTALAVTRGVLRLFARHDIFGVPEVPLPNGRRLDIMAVDAQGHIIAVEIKCSRADLLGDGKWPDYFDYCDRYFWAVPAGFDLGLFGNEALWPGRTGLIVADQYDAEIVRPAPSEPLAPARRKAEVQRLARRAARRLAQFHDPDWAGRWGDESSEGRG